MEWVSRLFALIVFWAGSVFADSADPALSHLWLNLYHYESTFFGGYKSDVVLDTFFFSPRGRTSPHDEFKAAQKAFRSPETLWGLTRLPAACAFPARKRVLERLTQEIFPAVNCPDLDQWLNGINANQVSLVYIGAYSGNPASILGHTFLRFSNRLKESSGRAGAELLSYSVGFLATPTPGDNPVLYALNGILGFYPGFFEIEPHYMKVGLYNNSESRDLWEWPLNHSPEDVDLMLRSLWEMHFNGRFDYYFFDKNCSYRLLKLLNLGHDGPDLTHDLPWVVLPAETVRQTVRQGLVAGPARFRSSIERKVSLKVNAFSKSQREIYEQAKSSDKLIENLDDIAVLDALVDYWTHRNYELRTQLSAKEGARLEATFSQRAKQQLPLTGPGTWTQEQIRAYDDLQPPTDGHGNSWWQLYAHHSSSTNTTGWGVSYTPGAHALWQSPIGYDDVANIEYLGLDLEHEPDHDWRWRARIARATSIENFWGPVPRPSWQFDLTVANSCAACDSANAQVLFHGSYGLGFRLKRSLGFLMGSAKTQTWNGELERGVLAPGSHLGLRHSWPGLTVLLEHQAHWWRGQAWHEASAQATFHAWRNRDAFMRVLHDSGPGDWSRTRVDAGVALFF